MTLDQSLKIETFELHKVGGVGWLQYATVARLVEKGFDFPKMRGGGKRCGGSVN